MRCVICKNGATAAGKITVMLDRNGTTLVFKDVPADICENCGEEYVSSEVSAEILRRAQEAARKGVDLELLSYAA